MAKMRIQKALGDAGIMSRRKAEEYIAAGKITVNGHKAQPGHPVDTAKDIVAIEGKRVVFPRRKENIYIMLNKPRGYVTTTSDELGRRCVTELVENLPERVYPVGRLDKNTEGVLLLTNDGQFANLLMHPSNHITKTYRVTVRPDITDEQAARLAAGVDIGEGVITQPAQVHVMEKAPGRVVLQITISEGKNRQIRRMCEAVGLEVARLKRISVGPQKLGMLQPGEWRELKKSEVLALRNAGRPIQDPASQSKPKPAGRPLRSSSPNAGSHSFGTDQRRGVRRKDGFVGAKKEDDYSFTGGYSKAGSKKPTGKPVGRGSASGKPAAGKSFVSKTGSKTTAYGKRPVGKPTSDKRR